MDHPGQTKEEEDLPPPGHRRGKERVVVKSKTAAKMANFKTVCSYFRDQLNNLINMLMSTEPSFIRCIVPNNHKKPGVVDPFLVMHQLTCNGVLEGIRICRKGYPNRIIYNDFRTRYVILAPKESVAAMKKVKRPVTEEKKNIAATHAVMDKINLVGDKFQYGHTKIFFRAGILGLMEEIRDDCINNLVAMLQGTIRAYYARRIYNRLWAHKMGLLVAQRTIRGYMIGKTWLWWSLWLALKPGLKSGHFEEFKQQLAEKIQFAQDHLDEVIAQREVSEKKHAQLTSEVDEIKVSLAGGTNAKEDLLAKISKLEDIKGGLQKEINALNTKINQENENIENLQEALKKTEASQGSLGGEMRECESRLAQVQDEKADKDAQIKQMKEECLHQEELINKLNKEKKSITESKMKEEEQIQSFEDKCNHLNKLKIRLEKSLDEVEESWEREKKQKGDIEKLKRQVEGNLKLTQETITDLERNKIETGQVLQRKEKENSSLNGKVEDEQTLGGKLNTQIKELQARLEELDEELEGERASRARADKGRGQLRRELDELHEKLEETGSNTAAQIALNTRREEELAKLKMELDESNITHESTLAMLRQKHNGAIAEMGEQIDTLNKAKAKTEKERNGVALELEEAQQNLKNDQNEKMALEKQGKMIQQQIYDAQGRLEELQRALHEADGSKRKITVENCDLVHQFEEAERNAATLSKDRSSLTTQLEDAKRLADAETRERINLLGKMRNLQHEMEVMKEHLEEEADAKMEVERQLSKAFADIQLWKTRYETEGVARCEEIDKDKAKVAGRLAEAEDTITSLQEKIASLEKSKARAKAEFDDLSSECERHNTNATIIEKRGRNFDKVVNEWRLKAEDLQNEIAGSQTECRNYSSEYFRIKAANEEIIEHLDQLGEGGRSMHELDKSRRKLEIEKEELQNGLEEAEAALEQEENKVLRAQLEMSQVRQEIDRRIQEKEEEVEHSRKNHQRALESMQASLEAEARAKEEALRIKKKNEADINEMEIALDHANKAHNEGKKAMKRTHMQLGDVNAAIEEERKIKNEVLEAYGLTERKVNAMNGELEESKALLDAAIRGQRQVEQELIDGREQVADVTASNNSLGNAKRKLENDIHQMQADLDNMLASCKNSEEKAKKAMVEAGRLADELRSEQDHAAAQEKSARTTEVSLAEMQNKAEQASFAIARGAAQIPAKLEDRAHAIEMELNRTIQHTDEVHKTITKGERRVKELLFQQEENKKNQDRITDLVDKLQQKIKSYKKQIEEAEEIAAINLAKFRKAQQDFEEAEERSKICEANITKYRSARGASMTPGPM